VKVTLRPEQRPSGFHKNAVPLTLEFAMRFKEELATEMAGLGEAWHVEDRLLCVIHPEFKKDVEAYYEGRGRPLHQTMEPYQLERFDRLLLTRLIQTLEAKMPGFAAALGIVADHRGDEAGD